MRSNITSTRTIWVIGWSEPLVVGVGDSVREEEEEGDEETLVLLGLDDGIDGEAIGKMHGMSSSVTKEA